MFWMVGRLVRYLKYIPKVLFMAALPLFLVLSSVRWSALDRSTYQQGYAKYRITQTTGLSQGELETAARQLISYFSGGEPVSLLVRKDGVLAPIYNEREMLHLVDVRDLFQLTFRIQEMAGLYLVGFVALSFAVGHRGFFRRLGKLLLVGSGFTLGLFATVFALASLDFDGLFLSFHLVSFANDLWKLDPNTDYLVAMFPQGFWLDVTLGVVMRSLVAAIAIVLVGFGILLATARPVRTSGCPTTCDTGIS